MAGQQRANDRSLNADPPPMDQPHFTEPALAGGGEVLPDDRGDVARRESMKVERILDRDAERLVGRGQWRSGADRWLTA